MVYFFPALEVAPPPEGAVSGDLLQPEASMSPVAISNEMNFRISLLVAVGFVEQNDCH
jgi:hypothetical protein